MNRIIILISVLFLTASCSTGSLKNNKNIPEEQVTLTTNPEGRGPEIFVDLKKGESFYYPLFAIWIEDESGNYIQTLYVARSVATGVFKFGSQEKNRWITTSKRAPQSLPYWAHKRGIKASDGLYVPDDQTSVPDAYTGATPITGFVLSSRADEALPEKFRVMLEINQNWDWNEYWTNNKYPDDENYKKSCQPALVYAVDVDRGMLQESYLMKAIGHSHYSGKTGELFTDLGTLTTALNIAGPISVRVNP